MKIKTKALPYEQVLALPRPKHVRPRRPAWLFRSIIRLLSVPELAKVGFTYTKERMAEAGEGPYLILMNHSAFIDLKIASRILYPMPYCIVCTSDGFVGKEWLMRRIGCIPTPKFVTDASLVADIFHTLNREKTSVLMYPEASYSFDGCATPLPSHLAKLIKRAGVPVLYIQTEGAFLHDPLYNGLQLRRTKVKAVLRCLFTREEVRERSAQELGQILETAFTFDHFARQYETGTEITEPFRAEGLERILYRCAACGTEGKMESKGTRLTCAHCGKTYEMDTLGRLHALEGETEFAHIPDWYRWERACVRREIEEGSYRLDTAVKIGVLADYKAIYMVGEGRLRHDETGFCLDGCRGALHYTQSPRASYGLYADYYWYEIDDVICIGDKERLYYCFPEGACAVAKARLAAEEMYKMAAAEKKADRTGAD